MVYPKYRRPFEELTSIDERVDYIHNQVLGIQLGLNKVLEKEGIPPMAVMTREVVLSTTVQLLQGVRVWRPCPLTGRIAQMIPHWPDGCDALVDIAFGHGDTWVMPRDVDTFIALNDATPVMTVDEPVAKGEQLWMIVRNTDGREAHSVSITVTVIGVP